VSNSIWGALKIKERKKQDRNLQDNISENTGTENARPENAGLDFEGPFRRSNGVKLC